MTNGFAECLRCREFRGPVAQWSEQGTHNPSVDGSIPSGPTALCAGQAPSRARRAGNAMTFRPRSVRSRVETFVVRAPGVDKGPEARARLGLQRLGRTFLEISEVRSL